MKKAVFSFIMIMGILTFSNDSYAAQYQQDGIDSTNTEQNTAVSALDDSDLIVVMEDGSVVHGEVEITSMVDPTDKILVNSDLDGKAISVEEYKENPSEVETKDFPRKSKFLRAGSPPAYTVGLSPRASYSSAAFSARGWRFAERYYYPTGGNGPFLRWQTYVDSGVVGGILAAGNTYRYGKYSGEVIYPGRYSYVEGLATYYTYNPIPGTWFYVANY